METSSKRVNRTEIEAIPKRAASIVAEPVSLRFDERRGDDMRRLVIIPLVQNAIGGAALMGLCGMALYLLGLPIDSAALIGGATGFSAFCGATFVRFFADDIGLLAAMYNAGYRAASAEAAEDIEALREQLADEKAGRARDTEMAEQRIAQAQRPIIVNRAGPGRETFVKPAGGSEIEDAAALLLQTEDGGYLPGRDVSGLSPQAQAAAVAVLHATGLTTLAGTRTRITASRNEVYRALSRLVEADKQTSPE